MNILKAVVFDSDGTLVNTTRLIIDGFKKTLLDYGYHDKATEEEVRSNIGKHIPEVFASITGLSRDSKIVQDMVQHLDRVQDDIARSTIKSYPGEKEVLTELKTMGIRVGLFTSGTIYQVRRNFTAVGIDSSSIFDAMVTYEDNLPSKPAIEGLIACADKLEVRVSELFYVGDQSVDMAVGKQAGALMTIGLSHGIHSDKVLTNAGADHIAHNLKDILDIIGSI